MLALSEQQVQDIEKLYEQYLIDIETRAAETIAAAEKAAAQCKAI